MKPRVLFVDTGKEWGGGTNSLLLLAAGLLERGYGVAVAFLHDYSGAGGHVSEAFARAGIGFHCVAPEGGRRRKIAREVVRILLAFRRSWREAALNWLDRRLRIEPMARRIAELARKIDATLLVGNNQPSSNQEVLRAGQLARLPVALHVRKTTSLRPAERALANAAARKVICVSDSVRRHYIRHGLNADLCVTIPNGIDPAAAPPQSRETARQALGLTQQGFVVGTVCSLMPLKCVDHLLEAFAASLPALGAHATCAVIGDGAERGRLERLAAALDIAAQVRFAGFRDDAAALLPALDVFVLPSRQEGMPRSILEAMLAEVPVVAADVSGSRDIVVPEETGFLYPHGAVAQLASLLKHLAADPDRRQRFGARARGEVLARYTLVAHVDRVAAALDEAAA